MREIRGLPGQLGRIDEELLYGGGDDTPPDDRDDDVRGYREGGVPGHGATDGAEQHETGCDQGHNRGQFERGKGRVEIGVTSAHHRPRRREQQARDVDEPRPRAQCQEDQRYEHPQMPARGGLHSHLAAAEDKIAAQPIERDGEK